MVWNTSSTNFYNASKTDYNKYNFEEKNPLFNSLLLANKLHSLMICVSSNFCIIINAV